MNINRSTFKHDLVFVVFCSSGTYSFVITRGNTGYSLVVWHGIVSVVHIVVVLPHGT